MKKPLSHLCLAALVIVVPATALGQVLQSAHIGYVYPAGGQTGTTFEVAIGGQGLQKVEAIQVTGPGVRATFVEHVANYKRKLQEQYRVVAQQNSGNKKALEKSKQRKFGPPPDHEMFTRLEELSTQDFRQVAGKFRTKESVQRNREINELVILEISIDADAPPGMRELRLLTGTGGASNPLRFMVNTLPESLEFEPNDLVSPEQSHLQPPFIINGQIMPGDEDRFSFDAIRGQQLVIHVKARELVPYLADAVPGWFQAVVTVLDDKGAELAYADDFQFDPDPALLFEAPENGTYHVVIRDSIYRGREDFVYRVAVGEIPFVTGIFPLGAQLGSESTATLYGWNLDAKEMRFNTSVETRSFKQVHFEGNGTISNSIFYAVGSLPESVEKENNDTLRSAGAIKLQSVVNGRIGRPGDVDLYRFKARKGETVKAAITARRLRSPLDSLLRLLDGDGTVLAWNDDMSTGGLATDRVGLLTHNADSELQFTIPTRGTYYLQVTDTQNQGGEQYAYRLSLAQPQPGFDVFVTPSSVTVPGSTGGRATLHVRRIDGFAGPVEVTLDGDSSHFLLSGGRIPAGQDSIPVVIGRKGNANTRAAPPVRMTGMGRGWNTSIVRKRGNTGIDFARLELTASANINGEKVSKRVRPADEVTQAFITRHLVETHDLTAFVPSAPRQLPSIRLKDTGPLTFSAGESVFLDVRSGMLPDNFNGPFFELESAPPGLGLETDGSTGKTRLKLVAGEELETGLEGNLVVAVHFEITPRSKDGKRKSRKVSFGVLPAIPYRTR